MYELPPVGAVIDSEVLINRLKYQGRKYTYCVDRLKLPNGKIGDYEYIKHPGAGIAVPITAEGKFVLVKQYRFAIARYILEFPAGTLELNENPADTIKRELEEETGFRGHSWQKLGSFFLCPGYSDEIIHAYLAQDLEKLTHPPDADEDEEIEVVLCDRSELEQMINSGDVGTTLDAKSITGFYLALRYLDKL
jgi:ADP-ribose pyrophosphatase